MITFRHKAGLLYSGTDEELHRVSANTLHSV